MNKKDRIAIVFSIAYGVIPVSIIFSKVHNAGEGFLITIFPLFVYWSYRFVKGDISFIKKRINQVEEIQATSVAEISSNLSPNKLAADIYEIEKK